MKKFIIGSLFIFSSIISFGQVTGDGLSPATAYYGNLRSGILRWDLTTHSSGTVYVGRSGTPLLQDLTITEDGMLEIGAGITVVFCTQNSDLRITAAGVLEANGTYSDKITFTQLSGNPLWGHLVFKNNPGPSILNNCIIENGSANFLIDQYNGGGIFAEANNLTISNCIIRNNTAGASGGGIYANGSVRIENCIIYSNSTGGDDVSLGGGGVYLTGNATLTNSTIIENLSTEYGLGDDVLIASGTARVRNSIIWRQAAYGFSVYFSVAPASSSLTNCAFFEAWNASFNEIPPDFFTASLSLNTINDASDGPNFNDPANNNYTIKLISPCRDAGTDQGTPPPPLTDFLGNGRSGPYDIGAYEVLYSGWKLTAVSTDWTNVLNWDGGVPTTASDVVIPDGAANYPTATPAPDFTIGTGKLMAIEPGARVTLGVLTNNGTLRLNNSATKSSSLILSGYIRGASGTEEIQLTLAGGGTEDDDNFKWHYISVPVASLPVSVFDPADPVDIAQYIESRPTFSLLQGWVDYTGYVYSTGSTNGPKITDLVAGKGYNYWDDTDNIFMLSGNFNLSDVSVNLGFSGNPQLSGFNLLGNPFSCGLDWDYILNSGSFPANTSKALYFTRDNQQATYANGVGIPGDVNGIIPPMQGFFNKTYATGNSITLPLAARTHNNIHDRYKGSAIIPLVRLGISENSVSDETVLRFDQDAKQDLDLDFDAIKMFISASQPYIYSLTSGVKYAINGQPFPEEATDIPIVVNITTSGNHVLTAKQVQGLDDYYVTLYDNVTGYKVDLKYLPRLIFNATPGVYTDRFVLKISTYSTGIENPVTADGSFNVYPFYEMLNIEPLADEWNGKKGTVRILDLTGKPVSVVENAEFFTNSLLQIKSPGAKGIYFVEIRSGAMRYTGKVVIK